MNVTWIITIRRGDRPNVSGTSIYEGVKVETGRRLV
jgi:hypothetical protein